MSNAMRNMQDDSSYNSLTISRGPSVGRPQLSAADRARGERAREIREALGIQSQYDMVDVLNKAARQLGLAARYRYYTISRIESGSVKFEDATAYVHLDPKKRGWEWFVTGQEHHSAKHADPASFKKVSGGAGRRK